MQRWGAVRLLLTGLLAGGLIASGAAPVGARPHQPAKVTLTARVAPGTVSVGEPATLAIRLRPATRGVRLVVQRRAGSRWVPLARPRTDADGKARVRLPTSAAGEQRFRVLRKAARRDRRAKSSVARLTISASAPACTPRTALVDRDAGPSARCLAARLDRWQAAGTMAVGQQLNVSNSAYAAPLTALGGRPVHVVGFDLKELVDSEGYAFPVPPIDYLTGLAQQGAVLSLSWHPDNPGTSQANSYDDRSWTSLDSLLQPTPAATKFWADFDAGMAQLLRLQDAGAAVVFRPLHEANGDWFWWGDPAPATYRAVWTAMQERAAALGVHNVLWAYSFNADTGDNTSDPLRLLPARVDLAGMDSYAPGALSTAGYAAVAAKVTRMAFTEVGPYDRPDGSWDPAEAGRAARTLVNPPIWSMLWFDDAGGKKQLGSLHGGLAWLDSCRGGFCSVG